MTATPISGTFVPLQTYDKIIYGPGTVTELQTEVETLGGKKVAIVTGKSLNATTVIPRIQAILGDKLVGTFPEITQHAPIEQINAGVEFMLEKQVDLIVSVGGGSPIDATKVIIKFLAEKKEGHFIPHIAIPTTLSSAAFGAGAAYIDANGKKSNTAHPKIVPRVTILDSELTLFTVDNLWLSSGIKAVDHAVETLYSRDNQPNPVDDALAIEALRKLFENLPKSKANPEDLVSRQELQIASFLSWFPSKQVKSGLSHEMGRILGAQYKIVHGITSCICLPAVMRHKAKTVPRQLARVTRAIDPQNATNDDMKDALHAADLVQNLIKSLGLVSKLKDFAVKETDLPVIQQRVLEKHVSEDGDSINHILKEIY